MANSIIETITPEKAMAYLEKSGGNRNISKSVIDSYALTMKTGKWLLNGEPIVFDIEDRLLNGHHRLHAIIKSGTPISTFVVRGVEHDCFTTYDCGRHRTVGQLIGMQGIKNYNSVASTVQFVYKLERGLSISEVDATKRYGKSNTDMIELFNTDRKGYIDAGNFAVDMFNRARVLDKSMVGGVFYHLKYTLNYDDENIRGFFEQICSLDSCGTFTLNEFRKRVLKDRQSKIAKMNRNIILALLIKTWNYYIQGVTDRKATYSPDNEKFPQFIQPIKNLDL